MMRALIVAAILLVPGLAHAQSVPCWEVIVPRSTAKVKHTPVHYVQKAPREKPAVYWAKVRVYTPVRHGQWLCETDQPIDVMVLVRRPVIIPDLPTMPIIHSDDDWFFSTETLHESVEYSSQPFPGTGYPPAGHPWSPTQTQPPITIPPPTAVPEPSSWLLMILGFGAIGAFLRGRRVIKV